MRQTLCISSLPRWSQHAFWFCFDVLCRSVFPRGQTLTLCLSIRRSCQYLHCHHSGVLATAPRIEPSHKVLSSQAAAGITCHSPQRSEKLVSPTPYPCFQLGTHQARAFPYHTRHIPKKSTAGFTNVIKHPVRRLQCNLNHGHTDNRKLSMAVDRVAAWDKEVESNSSSKAKQTPNGIFISIVKPRRLTKTCTK